MNIKSLFPVTFKERLHRKATFFHFLLHDEEVSPLAYRELALSKAYETLRRKYSFFLEEHSYVLSDTTTPKIIWWCWMQGEENTPPICKACLWSVRKHYPDYEVRVVTSENMSDYIHLPKHVMAKYEKGIIGNTHFSDILRSALLAEYGGVWIDSTVFVTGNHDNLFEEPLFVFQDWKYDLPHANVASNWLMVAHKSHPIICVMRDLLYEYWKDNDKDVNYLFYYLFFHMATDKYSDLWQKVPRYLNTTPTLLQYEMYRPYSEKRFTQLCRMTDFHKLNWKHTGRDDLHGTYYEKILSTLNS